MKYGGLTNSVIKSLEAIEFLVSAKGCDLSTISLDLSFPKSTA